MNAHAIQRVLDDKRKRQLKSRLAREESERAAQIIAQKEAEQAAAKAAEKKEASERPFQDEVARRLEEYKTTKGDK